MQNFLVRKLRTTICDGIDRSAFRNLEVDQHRAGEVLITLKAVVVAGAARAITKLMPRSAPRRPHQALPSKTTERGREIFEVRHVGRPRRVGRARLPVVDVVRFAHR